MIALQPESPVNFVLIADDGKGGIDSSSVNILIDTKGSASLQTLQEGNQASEQATSSVLAVETLNNEIFLEINQQKQLNASAILSNATRSDEILWLSSNAGVVSVDSKGQLTRHAPGDVVIFAKSLLDLQKQQVIRVTEPVKTSPMDTINPTTAAPAAFEVPSGLSPSNVSLTHLSTDKVSNHCIA